MIKDYVEKLFSRIISLDLGDNGVDIISSMKDIINEVNSPRSIKRESITPHSEKVQSAETSTEHNHIAYIVKRVFNNVIEKLTNDENIDQDTTLNNLGMNFTTIRT